MTDATMRAILLALMLILPISALVARRLPMGENIKMALAWVAIFGVLVVLVALWQSATGVASTSGGQFQ